MIMSFSSMNQTSTSIIYEVNCLLIDFIRMYHKL